MKKLFSVVFLLGAFCLIGNAQSATPAKKAMLMGGNSQVKDVKTGEVSRIVKPIKTVVMQPNIVVQMNTNTGGKATTKKAAKVTKATKKLSTVPVLQNQISQPKKD